MKRATTTQARRLRKTPTDAERRLWLSLRYQQLARFKFRRQAPIGPYIVDFVCFENKLVIEVDGGQHAEHEEKDTRRTRWLALQGFRLMRFWNHEVLTQMDAVLATIERACRQCPPLPACVEALAGRRPSPTRGEGK